MQQPKFSGRNLCRRSPDGERHGVAVQFKVRRADAGGHRLFKASQYGPYPGGKLACAERLGDVVVGAKVEPAYAIGFTRFGGEKEYRNAREVVACPDLPADFKAALARDHDVQEKEGRRMLARQRHDLVACNTDTDIESGQLQVVADQITYVRIVFKHNNVLFHQLAMPFA